MIETNLGYEYVGDIPWEKNPAFAFSNDSESYLNAFKNVVDKLPVKGLKISFSDDVWNFNPYFDGTNSPGLKVLFGDIPESIKDHSKFFVLYGIMGKRKISTMNLRVSNAISIISGIIRTTAHDSIKIITTEDIVNEIMSRDLSSEMKYSYYESVYQFYYFLINNYRMKLPIDLNALKIKGIENKVASKKEDTKLPNIPDEFFNSILPMLISVMRKNDVDYNSRASACLMVMLTQLGLRTGDLLALKTDQLFSKKLTKSGRTAYYIHYKARKPSKPHAAMLEFDIFSNVLCTEAFQTLLKIREKCEFSITTDFLYVLDDKVNTKNEFPLLNSRFNDEYKRLMMTYLREECEKPWEGISPIKCRVGVFKDEVVNDMYIPETRQYRVHLCTYLYEHGVSLTYIQRYMGHLSESMLGYYVRPKDTYQENIAYSEKVIKDIAVEDLSLLGGTYGDEIKDSILEFIKENNIIVEKDIKAIVQAFGDKVLIRGKTGGVCIKTSFMACSKDARTNEMYCAYNICPNLFHFFYMVDITYMDFQTLQGTYDANTISGQKQAAQKELNKLKDLCRRRLLPELEELDKELERKGNVKIVETYPSLLDIITNKESIKREVTLWMKKN